jgi:hypothetical protein
MASDEGDSREQGIEFGSLAEDLEDESYPISHDDLLDRYGDRELELPDGRTTVSEILQPENEAEYDDAEGVRQAIFAMVGDGAIGREDYTDRGGNASRVDPSEETDSA